VLHQARTLGVASYMRPGMMRVVPLQVITLDESHQVAHCNSNKGRDPASDAIKFSEPLANRTCVQPIFAFPRYYSLRMLRTRTMTSLSHISQQQLHSILTAGILAPSADNRHLFRYSILEDRVLMRTSDAYLRANAQTRLLGWISFGAVVENMHVQASAYAIATDVTWFPSKEVICEIRLRKGERQPDALLRAIPERHTNRRFFSGPRLSVPERSELEKQLPSSCGVSVVWLDSPPVRAKALRLIKLAEAERFRSRGLHAELFSSLRFDVGHNSSCEEGIPIGAAEVELPARPLFRLMRDWRTMRALNILRAYRFFGWRAAYLPARLSPHLALIRAQGDIRTAAIQAGRGFERLWLWANDKGLALQPLAAAALYARPEFEDVGVQVREELRRGWAALAPGGTPMMVFRLGYAGLPSVRAGRPPLSRFLSLAE